MDIHNQPIAVLGAGSWGTALALHLARLKFPVRLWTIETDHAQIMQTERVNQRYLPGYDFPPSLIPIPDLADTIAQTQDILIAVPSAGFRSTLVALKPLITPATRFICATKGLDETTGQLLHEVAIEVLGNSHPYAVLSGPSFAKEVAAGLPTAVMIASKDDAFAKELITRFNSPIFRTYASTDIIGVEISATVKNVLAIATGISDGMGFGTNARCALITRGLNEMQRLGVALGAQADTFIGLAGLGDLVLTCSDDQSRNRRFGLALGHGQQSQDAETAINQVVEGKRNAELVTQLAQKYQVTMPICEMVWQILEKKYTPKEAMQRLLAEGL
jgi:glycerol-3-phosphate dehydrogenase (NAD(P)+)